jgi:hypothetical protein
VPTVRGSAVLTLVHGTLLGLVALRYAVETPYTKTKST